MRSAKSLALIALFAANAANGQTIKPYNAALFGSCTEGPDLGEMTKGGNPAGLLGSLVYEGQVLDKSGRPGPGLAREPIAVPIETEPSQGPETPTCAEDINVSASASISVLGLGISAAKNEVYRVRVRLIAKQRVSMVPEGGKNEYVWNSQKYKDNFRLAFASIDPKATTAYFFDTINLYILEVERYQKTSGLFGSMWGGVAYARDNNFKGTRVIVTGASKPLFRSNYTAPTPAPLPVDQAPGASSAAVASSITPALSAAELKAATVSLQSTVSLASPAP